ncbi:MAG: UDP-N-acetylmuramoyl-tripeptide--D-alanyl-D-alanine ligase [Synechococcales bacterium]|nr:UDP-N-acetylmuramoyl-tripeptide--D-alanyl-D-alanine ligase [Synechococcales bacterium]
MSFQASLAQICEAAHGQALQLTDLTAIATGINTDSRTIQPGQVFLALRGDKFDGHNFVTTAIAAGAIAAIVDAQFVDTQFAAHQTEDHLPLIQVTHTLAAYQAIARWWRRQFEIPVIGITGSVGKTTTKELVAALLSHYGSVLKSQANFNNEIGVPKTLLELNADHDFAVIEMGMRGRGQIAELARTAEPTIAMITTVGTAHIELLGSREAIAEAKCELFAELHSDGIAVFPAENELLVKTAAQVWQGQTISYGFHQGALQAHAIDPETLEIDGVRYPSPLPGEHNLINYLGGLAIAKALNLSWEPFIQGVTVDLPGGRAKRYDLPQDIALLDETYNAGLESMLAALKLLAQTPGRRHIAVLGTMRELGDFSLPFHHQVGEKVQELHLDYLLILADPAEAEALAQGAGTVPTEQFATHAAVIARLQALMQPGDRILFKASRAVGLDQVVQGLMRPGS